MNIQMNNTIIPTSKIGFVESRNRVVERGRRTSICVFDLEMHMIEELVYGDEKSRDSAFEILAKELMRCDYQLKQIGDCVVNKSMVQMIDIKRPAILLRGNHMIALDEDKKNIKNIRHVLRRTFPMSEKIALIETNQTVLNGNPIYTIDVTDMGGQKIQSVKYSSLEERNRMYDKIAKSVVDKDPNLVQIEGAVIRKGLIKYVDMKKPAIILINGDRMEWMGTKEDMDIVRIKIKKALNVHNYDIPAIAVQKGMKRIETR